MEALIFDIDHFAAHDGPGIRTNVYFKGCPLRCRWCHSPESQSPVPELILAGNRCTACRMCADACENGVHIFEESEHRLRRDLCRLCRQCESQCAAGAVHVCGKHYSVDQLLAEVLPDKPFYQMSGGGVTASGGEILMQSDFLFDFFSRLKGENIHTLAETSGYGEQKNLLKLADVTDIFYFDFKLWDPDAFRYYTGGDIEVIKNNLRALSLTGKDIVLRVPVIHGITDTDSNIMDLFRVADEYGLKSIQLLPYNQSAPEKYGWVGRPYSLNGNLSPGDRINEIMSMAPVGISVTVE